MKTQCKYCGVEFYFSPSAERKFCSLTCYKKAPRVTGEGSNHWKGDEIRYGGIHQWIRRTLGTASKCSNSDCSYPKIDRWGRRITAPRRYEWANISGEYKRDIKDWHELCGSCNKKDGIRKPERFLNYL